MNTFPGRKLPIEPVQEIRPLVRSILLTGGIGDTLTIEAMFRPEDRESLEAIYYACPQANKLIELWKLFQNYPRRLGLILLLIMIRRCSPFT